MRQTILSIFIFLCFFQFKPTSAQDYLIEGDLDEISQAIHTIFEVPHFEIDIHPCGEENAYSYQSSGDIVICSELLINAPPAKRDGLFTVVLLHELGHTLLNLWGLPNFDNERTADEFATVFLIMFHGGEYLDGWVTLFDKNINPYNETRALILNEGKHPLTVQRVDAVQEIMRNDLPVIKRWNRVLYPRMRDQVLQAIIHTPSIVQGADVELAKQILDSRN